MKVSKPFVILLVASLLFGVYLVFFTGTKKTAPVSPAKQPTSLPGLPKAAASRAETPVARPDVNDIAWGRDPFLHPGFFEKEISTKPLKSALKLEAILEGDRGRVAIIDKEVVVRGDVIGNEKVQEIGKDKVVLIGTGSKRLLLLGEPQTDEQSVKGKTEGHKTPVPKEEGRDQGGEKK